jgi:hypothetical protein
MRLTLTNADIIRLETAPSTLDIPLAFDSISDWRNAGRGAVQDSSAQTSPSSCSR